MTREVILEESASIQASAYLDDQAGVAAMFAAVDALAENPEPAESSALGSENFRRLAVGRYRVMYRISDAEILVERVGRVRS